MPKDIKERLADIRKSLDTQIDLDVVRDSQCFITLGQEEAQDLILLIDTFLRWDYEIR